MQNKTEYLSDVERELVVSFNENPQMKEAVKKVLLAGLYENGTLRAGQPANFKQNVALGLVSHRGDYTNEQIGADLRAVFEGGAIVENAFEKISTFVREEPKKKGQNPAR
jgi:hypothetical protein